MTYDEENNIVVNALMSDYKKIVSGVYEEDSGLIEAFKTIFTFYLTPAQQTDINTFCDNERLK